jgi:hypothetical protein
VGITNPFGTGDRVEVDTSSSLRAPRVRALARVRESLSGRLHIAFEIGEYLPWIDGDVQIRHLGGDPTHSCTAKILHAGSTTALLQVIDAIDDIELLEDVEVIEELPSSPI